MTPGTKEQNLRALEKALKPTLDRLRLRFWLHRALLAMMCGSLAALLANICSWMVLVENRHTLVMFSGWITALSCVVLGFWRNPGITDAISEADRAGLAERLVTSHEFSDRIEPLYLAQRADALKRLSSFEPDTAFSISVSRKSLSITCALVLLNLSFLFIPYRFEAQLLERNAFRAQAKQEAEKVSLGKEEILEQSAEEDPLFDTMVEELTKLEQKLKTSRNPEQALRALDDADSALQSVKAETAQTNKEFEKVLDAVSDALAENENTEALAKKLSERDWAGIQEELAELSDKIGGLDETHITALQSALQNAGEAASRAKSGSSGPVCDACARLSASASTATIREFSDVLAQIGQSVDAEMRASDALQAVADARHSLLSAMLADSSQPGPGNSPAQLGTAGAAGVAGIGGAQSSGSGATSQNTGMGAGGVGSGSTNLKTEQGGEATRGQSAQGGVQTGGGRAEFEQIYDPDQRLGGDGNISQLTGVPGVGQSDTFFVDTPVSSESDYSEYREVLGRYEARAMEALTRSALPASMREAVKEYFGSLKP